MTFYTGSLRRQSAWEIIFFEYTSTSGQVLQYYCKEITGSRHITHMFIFILFSLTYSS